MSYDKVKSVSLSWEKMNFLRVKSSKYISVSSKYFYFLQNENEKHLLKTVIFHFSLKQCNTSRRRVFELF